MLFELVADKVKFALVPRYSFPSPAVPDESSEKINAPDDLTPVLPL